MRRAACTEASAIDDLLLLIAGTEARRAAGRPDVRRIVSAVDQHDLVQALDAQRLLPVGGARLEEAAGDLLDKQFRIAWQAGLHSSRARSLALEALTVKAIELLEGEGIRAMPLKGPALAAALYGDPGMRVSDDIDLLVPAHALSRAAEIMRGLGYREAPLRPHPLHETMTHTDSWMPQIELHWRIHWYEVRFSQDVLERASRDDGGRLRPRAGDQLAMLLLFFARDGFVGLRLAADIAACWDRYGAEIEEGALEQVALEYPELRDALVASALVAERLVGLPASELGMEREQTTSKQRLAMRLVNWCLRGDFHQLQANVKLVDWILTPAGGRMEHLRRHLLPRLGPNRRDHGIPAVPVQIVHSLKLLVRYGIALWRVRGGRCWSPLPASVDRC